VTPRSRVAGCELRGVPIETSETIETLPCASSPLRLCARSPCPRNLLTSETLPFEISPQSAHKKEAQPCGWASELIQNATDYLVALNT